MTNRSHDTLRSEVFAQNQRWIKHFNQGNVDACLSDYHDNAVMEAKLTEWVKQENKTWRLEEDHLEVIEQFQ